MARRPEMAAREWATDRANHRKSCKGASPGECIRPTVLPCTASTYGDIVCTSRGVGLGEQVVVVQLVVVLEDLAADLGGVDPGDKVLHVPVGNHRQRPYLAERCAIAGGGAGRLRRVSGPRTVSRGRQGRSPAPAPRARLSSKRAGEKGGRDEGRAGRRARERAGEWEGAWVGGAGQVAVRPCSMKVTASLTVSAILSRTITTAKRRLWRASRGCPTAVRQQGALGCHHAGPRRRCIPTECRHCDLVAVGQLFVRNDAHQVSANAGENKGGGRGREWCAGRPGNERAWVERRAYSFWTSFSLINRFASSWSSSLASSATIFRMLPHTVLYLAVVPGSRTGREREHEHEHEHEHERGEQEESERESRGRARARARAGARARGELGQGESKSRSGSERGAGAGREREHDQRQGELSVQPVSSAAHSLSIPPSLPLSLSLPPS